MTRASKDYRKQMKNAILNEYMELTMCWEERQMLISSIKDFKREHYNPNKGYECYTPESCLRLAKMQESLEKSGEIIKTMQKRVWHMEAKYNELLDAK